MYAPSSSSPRTNTDCLASYATETVMQKCHGRRKCTLSADSTTFGKPCRPDSRMYLKVVYTCGEYGVKGVRKGVFWRGCRSAEPHSMHLISQGRTAPDCTAVCSLSCYVAADGRWPQLGIYLISSGNSGHRCWLGWRKMYPSANCHRATEPPKRITDHQQLHPVTGRFWPLRLKLSFR